MSENNDKKFVLVCTNVDCRVRGGEQVYKRLEEDLQAAERPDVELRPYMCFGGCHDGPNVVIYPDKVWYAGVQEPDAHNIVEKYIKKGEQLPELTGKIDKGLEEMIYQLLDSGIY